MPLATSPFAILKYTSATISSFEIYPFFIMNTASDNEIETSDAPVSNMKFNSKPKYYPKEQHKQKWKR